MTMKLLIVGIIPAILWPAFVFAESPSIYDMAVSLILYEISSDSYLKANSEFDYYISVEAADLPPKYLDRISSPAVKFFPGSKWTMGKGMHMSIKAPKRRSDGDYDVSYEYYCGMCCASGNIAIMRFDIYGWHVISTKMLWIS